MQTIGRIWVVDDRPVCAIHLRQHFRIRFGEGCEVHRFHVVEGMCAVNVAVISHRNHFFHITDSVWLNVHNFPAGGVPQNEFSISQFQGVFLSFDFHADFACRDVHRVQRKILPDDFINHLIAVTRPPRHAKHIALRRVAQVHSNQRRRAVNLDQFCAAGQLVRHIGQQRLRQSHRRGSERIPLRSERLGCFRKPLPDGNRLIRRAIVGLEGQVAIFDGAAVRIIPEVFATRKFLCPGGRQNQEHGHQQRTPFLHSASPFDSVF